jgi:hypothetical protein
MGKLLDVLGMLALLVFVVLVVLYLTDQLVVAPGAISPVAVSGYVLAAVLGINLLRRLFAPSTPRAGRAAPPVPPRRKTNPLPLAAFFGIVLVAGKIIEKMRQSEAA